MRKILFLFLISIGSLIADSVDNPRQIFLKDGFKEFSPGIYYYVNEKDNYFEIYKQEGYTVERYIKKNIHPVVENFLNSSFVGDLEKLTQYLGDDTISTFEEGCRRNGVIRETKEEYRELLYNDLKLRKKICGNSEYFTLPNIFNRRIANIFNLNGDSFFFLIWLNPTYEKDKYYIDKNLRRSKVGLPWEGNVENGSDFLIYYLDQDFSEVGVYPFRFKPYTRSYSLIRSQPYFAAEKIEEYKRKLKSGKR